MTDIVERLRSYTDKIRITSDPPQNYVTWQAADEIERLRAFAKEAIQLSWEGAIDGGDIQELAEKHGLITPEIYDPAKHGENHDAVPGEDTIYIFTDGMKP